MIKNETEYYKALERLDKIFHAKRDTPESKEADFLISLINKWESENYPIEEADPKDIFEMKKKYLA